MELLVPEMLESQKSQAAKIVIKAAGRLFLTDAKDICYTNHEDSIMAVPPVATQAWKVVELPDSAKNFLKILTPACSGVPSRSFSSTSTVSAKSCPGSKAPTSYTWTNNRNPVSRTQTRRLRELFDL